MIKEESLYLLKYFAIILLLSRASTFYLNTFFIKRKNLSIKVKSVKTSDHLVSVTTKQNNTY